MKFSNVFLKKLGNKIVFVFILSSIMFIFSLDISAQVTEEWVARYNNPVNGEDYAYAVAVDSSGNVYVTGYNDGEGNGKDYITIKYNSAGVEEWVARYNGPKNDDDEAVAIAIDNLGNVYVTGYSIGLGTEIDYTTIKYNSDGVKQWEARYDGPGNFLDLACAITTDNLGNVYITGKSYGLENYYDYATIKYNSEGVVQWVARYNGPISNSDVANAIAVDNSGNVYVTGTSSGNLTNFDYATIKYNSEGAEQWVARYNAPANIDDEAKAIIVDSTGNVYVTGKSYGSGTNYDYATVKYNSAGVEQWVARYDGPVSNNDEAKAIIIDNTGNVYVTGKSYGSGTNYDYATIKYNSSGVEQWAIRYDGPVSNDDEAKAIVIDSAENVYVTGWSGYDYATIKYSSEGIEQYVARYDGPDNNVDGAEDIAIDSTGNIFVTGRSYNSGTNYDCATVKYNTAGEEDWVVRYDGPGDTDDEVTALSIDSFGNIYVTGHSYDSESERDYATVKYNNTGVEQWVARYNGSGNGRDYAYAIAIDDIGNVYVTGKSYGSGTNYDYATIKYNNAGVEQWVARYNGPGDANDEAIAITTDNSGNVYVTGYSYGSGTELDYATVKYNSAGGEEWVVRYDGPLNTDDKATAIVIDNSVNVYVTGYSYGLGTDLDYATVKYNNAGVEQWVSRYNGSGNGRDYSYAIAIDDIGNVYVTGISIGLGTSGDYATIKYDNWGSEQWVARYNGPESQTDRAYAIAIDTSGNLYVTGYSFVTPTDCDYATIKYNNLGEEQWVVRYNGPGNGIDVGKAIAIDSTGNVYVTGETYISGIPMYENSDYATIKYSQSAFSESFYLY